MCMLLAVLVTVVPGGTPSLTPPEDDLQYRDFLYRVPVKDYRKKLGQTVYRYPKLKVGLLINAEVTSIEVLVEFIRVFNRPRLEVDVILINMKDFDIYMNKEEFIDCHEFTIVGKNQLNDMEKVLFTHGYNSVVFVPSGESSADETVIQKVFSGKRRSNQKTLLLSPHSLITRNFTYWQYQGVHFDYSIYWGTTIEYLSLSRESAPQMMTDVYVSQQNRVLVAGLENLPFTSNFLNKVFVFIFESQQLTTFEHAGKLSSTLNLDEIKLLDPAVVFKKQKHNVFIKTIFG